MLILKSGKLTEEKNPKKKKHTKSYTGSRLKKQKKGLNKRLKVRGGKFTLSKSEEQVLDMISIEYLTPYQIAQRRKTTYQAVYKIIKRLNEKGAFNLRLKKRLSTTKKPFYYTGRNMIRLHGQEFNIKLISKSKKYIKKNNKIIYVDNNTIRIYKDSIEVLSNNSFLDHTCQEAHKKSMEYFKRIFMRLENDLGIVIMKDRHQNITQVKGSYAEINNELATLCIQKKQKIQVRAEDGRIFLLIDDSFNLNEMETVHPDTAKEDMENKIRPLFVDLRSHDEEITFSKLFKLNYEMLKSIKGNTDNHKFLIKHNIEAMQLLKGIALSVNNNTQMTTNLTNVLTTLLETVKSIIPKQKDKAESQQKDIAEYIG